MDAYYVEGLYINRVSLKKEKRGGKVAGEQVEPFARSIWAHSPEEAIQIATQELGEGQWVEEPRVSRTSEAQRMRAMGAPELPGLGAAPRKKKRTK